VVISSIAFAVWVASAFTSCATTALLSPSTMAPVDCASWAA
jgi:hypothetical protein